MRSISFPFFLLQATYSCQVWGQCGLELWIPHDSTVWLNLPFSFSEPLLPKANRLIQDLDQTFSELTALHDEVYTYQCAHSVGIEDLNCSTWCSFSGYGTVLSFINCQRGAVGKLSLWLLSLMPAAPLWMVPCFLFQALNRKRCH